MLSLPGGASISCSGARNILYFLQSTVLANQLTPSAVKEQRQRSEDTDDWAPLLSLLACSFNEVEENGELIKKTRWMWHIQCLNPFPPQPGQEILSPGTWGLRLRSWKMMMSFFPHSTTTLTDLVYRWAWDLHRPVTLFPARKWVVFDICHLSWS